MFKYKRILLKISGEALLEEGANTSVSESRLTAVAKEIAEAVKHGIEVGIVFGAGNFLRGTTMSKQGITRTTADHMGMLATILNALAIRDAIEALGISTTIFSAIPVQGIAQPFDYRAAIACLRAGQVALFGGGTGNPFVTTDSAASLRSIEINADLLLKATKVDGIYDADPTKNPDAKRYQFITYEEAMHKELAIMDLGAFCQCRDYNIPIRVFNLFKPGALTRTLLGADEGTLVAAKKPE